MRNQEARHLEQGPKETDVGEASNNPSYSLGTDSAVTTTLTHEAEKWCSQNKKSTPEN